MKTDLWRYMIDLHAGEGGRVDAVIFDCDGVLVDSEIIGLEESAAFLRTHGLDWSPTELIEQFSGMRDDQLFAVLTEAYVEANGAPPPKDFFEELYNQRRLSPTPLEAIAGAETAVAGLKGPVAVASSSATDRLETKLKHTGLWALFEPHVYSADRVDQGKPHPDIYLYTADKLGQTPAQCLVVEDSVNGVRSGVEAGMSVCGFTGGGHSYEGHAAQLLEAGAAWIARDFAQFTARLKAQDSH